MHGSRDTTPPEAAVSTQQIEGLLHTAIELHRSGQLERAANVYERLLALAPDHVQGLHLQGLLTQQCGRLADAVSALERAAALAPADPEIQRSLVGAYRDTRDKVGAARAQQRLCELSPKDAEAWHMLGDMLMALAELDGAARCYLQALQLQPTQAGSYNNLGNVRRKQQRPQDALACYEHAIALKPDFAEAHQNRGALLAARGRPVEARDAFAQALRYQADLVRARTELFRIDQELCHWDGRDEELQRILAIADRSLRNGHRCPLEPFAALSLPVSAAFQQALARNKAAAIAVSPSSQGGPLTRVDRVARPRRLRIGYVSSDFHDHATMHLLGGLFEHHDDNAFEIFAYSFGPDDDSVYRRRVRDHVDHFVDIAALDPAAAARRIADDGVHVLVDLKGYTWGVRPEIFALRPAPIQVNWLGFPGTTGAPYMDYIITDAVVTPPGQERFLDEQPVFMPECYQINDNTQAIDTRVPTRTECGLPEEAFVFCCFNNSYKIEPVIFNAWMDILKAIPEAVLWLLGDHEQVKENLRREARRRGVEPERLIFAERVDKPRHLARHQCADLFLDTHYCNAHTTASDALWAGLPLLAWPGETFASRVTASLLHAVGLSDLIVSDVSAYVAKAVAVARDSKLLARLHERLHESKTRSPLFDTQRFVRNLEQCYRQIWQRYLNAQPPAPVHLGHSEEAGHRGQSAGSPIFIGGAGRSGTTLVRSLLDSHPHIGCGPELKVVPLLASLCDDLRGVHGRWLRRHGVLSADVDGACARFIEELLAGWRRQCGKPRIAEKTPNNAGVFRQLHRMFPDSPMIHVIRDGRDVVSSLLQMDWRGPDGQRLDYTCDAKAAAQYWVGVVRAGRDAAAADSGLERHYIEIRYEELVREPETVLKRLFAALNEPWVPSVLEFFKMERNLGDESSAGQVSQPLYQTSVGIWRERLNPEQLAAVMEAAGGLLHELGYLGERSELLEGQRCRG